MIKLTIFLRMLYLLKHNCHNYALGMSFFSDHEFFGSSYNMTLGHYDSVVERMIGFGHDIDLVTIQSDAVIQLKNISLSYKNSKECFSGILKINQTILNLIEQLCIQGKTSQGVLQMLGTIADEIEIENYKIGQRIKG